jgi:uncharacterized integral membrane protein
VPDPHAPSASVAAKATATPVAGHACPGARTALLCTLMEFAATRAHPCTVLGGPRPASGYDQASVSTPARAQSSVPSEQPRRSRRELARSAAVAVLAVLITLFAVLNVKEVEVDWIFGSGKVPLIVVIVVSLLLGILITHFAELRARRRR